MRTKRSDAKAEFVRNVIIILAVILLLCGFYAMAKSKTLSLDNIILLEKRKPDYCNLVRSLQERSVLQSVVNNGSVNEIENNLLTQNYQEGFQINVNEDGSFTLSGTNNSADAQYIPVTPEDWYIPDGVYQISDSNGGYEVSSEGAFLSFEGINYEIGGNTSYNTLANLSDGPQTVTVDHNVYRIFRLVLRIEAGASIENVTFYPQMIAEGISGEEYQPATIINPVATDEPIYTYNYYRDSKESFLNLDKSDFKLLAKQIKYQNTGAWSIVDFGDGTGICFMSENMQDTVYGELTRYGTLRSDLGGIEAISAETPEPNEISDFLKYLTVINNPDYTVFISINDDGVSALNDEIMSALQQIGIQTPLSEKDSDRNPQYFRYSYYAVCNPGNLAEENIGTDVLTTTGMTRDGRYQYSISSSGFAAGTPNASIVIGGHEYSMNRRGMNIVVYSNAEGRVLDTVCFDTCIDLTCYHASPTSFE